MELTHKNLRVFKSSNDLLEECYKLTLYFPIDERFNLVQQIRRAATSVILNISEGSSRLSLSERKRFFEIARGSVVEIDSAPLVSIRLKYLKEEQLQLVTNLLNDCFSKLSKMIKTLTERCK